MSRLQDIRVEYESSNYSKKRRKYQREAISIIITHTETATYIGTGPAYGVTDSKQKESQLTHKCPPSQR